MAYLTRDRSLNTSVLLSNPAGWLNYTDDRRCESGQLRAPRAGPGGLGVTNQGDRGRRESLFDESLSGQLNSIKGVEIEPAGYLMRAVREAAGLTQRKLAERLSCSQQAVAQAERWESNPSIDFLRRWAQACDSRLEIGLGARRSEPTQGRQS